MEETKKSGWKLWLYLTPVYILIAIPLVKWTIKLNSSDVDLSKEDYSAFNANEGEIRKAAPDDYDPNLNDSAYSVRYRSSKAGARQAGAASFAREGAGRAAGTGTAGARRQETPAVDQQRRQPAAGQGAPAAAEQLAIGGRTGYLTYTVGKVMNNPKAVSALFNNKLVVQGFMNRASVKSALGSPQGLRNYLKNTAAINNFVGNGVVQAAVNNPAVVNALASSGMAGAILSSPGVQGIIQNPEALMQLATTNPQVMQLLSNPNVINALNNNPQTAGLAAGLGGVKFPKR